jgi:cytidylate kinase
MSQFIVTIDGGAGAGKSTTAKAVARRLDFFYLDTGAMYRAVTLKYLQLGGETSRVDMDLIAKIINETTIDLRKVDDEIHVYLDDKDVTQEIRTPRVNEFVSPISAVPEVRTWMVEKQREVAKDKKVVCEGRDIGTVVFPDAQVKIFMEADLQIRAIRRQKELTERKIKTKLHEVLGNLRYRDKYDSSRKHSPLKKARNAIVVDTTNLTIEEEIEFVEKIVKEKLLNS